jgi:NAD(P)-dependent dehydrogenase (short-subunit alcohol dehydrogenase family)
MSLENRRVVVTGGAMGIGRYIALGCAERGAEVAVGDIDDDGLKSVADELREFGHKVFALRTDVRSETDVRALMDGAADELGGIDYLVNNAGIVPHFQWGGPRWPVARDMDFEFWQRVIGTNLHGTWLSSKYAIPHLEKSKSGHIVNLYGGGALIPPGAMAYALTKEAGVVMARFLAEEVRSDNICVISLSPGAAIATERAPDEARQRMPGPESAGDRFFLAAEAGMDLSGHLVDLVDGVLVAVN